MWLGILFFSCLLVAFVAVVTTSDMGIKGIMQGSPHENRRVQRQKKRRLSPKEGRIVGGAPTGAGTYPFMVALYDTESLDSGALPICGGSLITPSVVLTSAECLFDVRAVQIGRYNFGEDEADVETYTELTTETHPQFDSVTLDFDYGLIKLDREQPDPSLVSIRRTREIPRELIIMGWGYTLSEGEQSEVLMYGNVSRFDTTRCANNYAPEPITESMFCANGDGVDICDFDAGGPVIIPGTNVQVGIASFPSFCDNATLPGVHSHVFWGFDWVEETICDDISPDDCTEDGRMKIVNPEGEALDATCDDREVFLGLGKKLQNRNCAWVGGRKEQRCEWYGEDYCPDTCTVDRCQEVQ